MNLPPLLKKALAEFLGVTLFLTAICGAAVYQNKELGTAALAAVLGLAILVTASISGGHLNPIVSIYFFSRREIGLVQLLVFLVAQITGGIFGAFIAGQMFLQTFMLLAVENGLATCAQEYWSSRHQAVSTFVGAPENEMLFCGMAIGYADTAAPINSLRAERMPVDEWARFI